MSKDLAFQESAKRAQENLQWDVQEPVKAVVALEFTEELNPELYGLEVSEAKSILGGLGTITMQLEDLKKEYATVIKLPTSVENMETFKKCYRKIVKNRTSREAWRKAKKSFFLNGGRFTDSTAKFFDIDNNEMEIELLKKIKFFENQEKEKARLLNLERIEKIRPYVEDADNMNFAEFDDENFDDFVFGKKTRFENEVKAKKEAEAKAEAERLAEIERQKAIEIENAKLKAEAEEKELILKQRNEALRPFIKYIRDYDKVLNLSDNEFKKEVSNLSNEAISAIKFEAEQERERLQKELDYENEKKKAKIEADKQAKIQSEKDAEIKKLAKELQAQKDIEEAKRLAKIEEAKAPINNQLINWVDSFELPELTLENDAKNEILLKFQGFKNWAKKQIK